MFDINFYNEKIEVISNFTANQVVSRIDDYQSWTTGTGQIFFLPSSIPYDKVQPWLTVYNLLHNSDLKQKNKHTLMYNDLYGLIGKAAPGFKTINMLYDDNKEIDEGCIKLNHKDIEKKELDIEPEIVVMLSDDIFKAMNYNADDIYFLTDDSMLGVMMLKFVLMHYKHTTPECKKDYHLERGWKSNGYLLLKIVG